MNDHLDNQTRMPACITEAITVGATEHTNNNVADFSNHAPWVRLMAPGVDIVAARDRHTTVTSCTNKGGGFCASSGTSMATPHVAGAFAVLRDVRTNSTVDDVAAALECSGVFASTRAGITKPRIDLLAAKNYLLRPPRTDQNFNFNANATGWIPVLGNWALSGGFLATTDSGGGYRLIGISNCNEGETLTANIWRQGSVGTNGQGIVFKAQIAGSTTMSGYIGIYDGAGHGFIRRFDNYNFANDTGQTVDVCTGSATADGTDQVRVVTRGGVHKLYVNGQLVCSGRDRAYGTGFTGVFAFFSPSSGSAIHIDDFIIDRVETVPAAQPHDELISASEPRPMQAGAQGKAGTPGPVAAR
jgi:subtilisin family serine protease